MSPVNLSGVSVVFIAAGRPVHAANTPAVSAGTAAIYNQPLKLLVMQNWLKALIAGGAAYKWGGGCVGTILIFVLVYFLLGSC